MLSMIVAHDKNRVIGNNGQLPWHLPKDLNYFKETTKDKIVIMGWNTFESLQNIPWLKPDDPFVHFNTLPDRRNIVLAKHSVDVAGIPDNLKFVQSNMDHLIYDISAWVRLEEEIFVIGGSKTYELFLPHVNRLYVTCIDYEFEGDTYFPEYNTKDWRLLAGAKGVKDDQNPYDYYFRIYERTINRLFDFEENLRRKFEKEYMINFFDPLDPEDGNPAK